MGGRCKAIDHLVGDVEPAGPRTQRISATIHAMVAADGAPVFDGILYPSRNNFPATSIALFDRASAKLKLIDDIDLSEHRAWPEFVRTFGIDILDDRF